MATPNLKSALDRPSSAVERPKPAPVGSYIGIIQGLPRYDKSTQKKTDFAEMTIKYATALEDVDMEALREWLTSKDGSTKALTDMVVKEKLYQTEGALFRIVDFLNHAGWENQEGGEDEDKSLREMLENSANRQIGFIIKHEAGDNGAVWARIDRTFRPE